MGRLRRWTGASSVSNKAWSSIEPSQANRIRIQLALGKLGLYKGPANGDWNIETRKGIQLALEQVGFTGDIDGQLTPDTVNYVQIYAKKPGNYVGPIDKDLGPNTWAGFAVGLENGKLEAREEAS